MLSYVRVRNIALIDEAEVEFEEGLNALTGETGAGKSILLGAITLALGSRAGKGVVRDESRQGEVDLLFVDHKDSVQEALLRMGATVDNGQILISRRFSQSGRSSCFINGSMVTQDKVRELSGLLIDIHGQHEHQSLLDCSRHIELLDRFVPTIEPLKKEMQKNYHEAGKLRKELLHYEETGRDRARLLELMAYELEQIDETAWQEGEEESLNEERRRLIYREKLQHSAMEAWKLLSGEDESGASCTDKIDRALGVIQNAAGYDAAFFEPFASALTDQLSILTDIAASLSDYAEQTESDPERLGEVEDRITSINRLKEKYGNTREKVLEYYEKTKKEQDRLQHLEETVEALSKELAGKEEAMQTLAETMTELRTKAAKRIEGEITKVLSTLQFTDPVFKVAVEEDKLGPNGKDKVVFMIRTNVGEKIQPLNKIASGGEMSRVMLAIKTVLAKEDEIGTLIFDEIDTGISGRTAQSVAEKMSTIARFRQVICVTHLPQIAAMADLQLVIEKVTNEEHTYTNIKRLHEEEIPEELSRMLGGAKITEAVYQNALEMKKLADEWKLRRES